MAKSKSCATVCAAPAGVIGEGRNRLSPLPWVVEMIPTARSGLHLNRADMHRLRLSRPEGFSIVTRGRQKGLLQRLTDEASRRELCVLCVVDGLMVWAHAWREPPDPEQDRMAFGFLPASTDRKRAVWALGKD